MFCKQCGVALNGDVKFCADCGAAVEVVGYNAAQADAAFAGTISQPVAAESSQGKWSFGIGLAMLAVWFLLVAVSAALAASAQEAEMLFALVGVLMFAAAAGNLVGLIFGIIALTKQGTKKVMAIIGLLLNIVAPLFILFLAAVGMAAG